MRSAPSYPDDLLDPIEAGQPAGADLRWTADWDRIQEARRSDDGLESGKWAKKERKSADWALVRQLATSMLQERSKDLQLALWLTEANIRLSGFAGLRDGLRVTRELLARYWDSGLFPAMEDGPEDRAGPFEWLNNKLVDTIATIPITARDDGGTDYSLLDLEDARRTGAEASLRSADGEIIDEQKKKAFDRAIAEGHVSMDLFSAALKATSRARFEELNTDFGEALFEFKELEKAIGEKFGEVAPSLADCRGKLNSIRDVLADLHEQKRKDEPDAPVAPSDGQSERTAEESGGRAGAAVLRLPLSLPMGQSGAAASESSWHAAEQLIRAGEVEKGLSEMARLAANETTGRNRFQRKLLLAEVCLATRQERLARLILEELAEQIDKLQLESWESSDWIGGVWARLYRLYKHGEPPDAERAEKLYERLCRLDPWQALGCTET